MVAGDKLDSFQELKKLGESYSISKSVKEAEKDLIKKLWALQENGCTALGPALMLSILIAVPTLSFLLLPTLSHLFFLFLLLGIGSTACQ